MKFYEYIGVFFITALSVFMCYGIGGENGALLGLFICIIIDFIFIESMNNRKDKNIH